MTSKKYQLALHIFRRDLRLQDNTALLLAHESADRVLPCFIFDPRQVNPHAYRSLPGFDFMLKSLLELNQDIQARGGQLYFFYGEAEDIIKKLLKDLPIDAVYFNRDYTPFSKRRDEKIIAECQNLNRDFYVCDDALLHSPESIKKQDQTPYTIFTPFYKRALDNDMTAPQKHRYQNFYQETLSFADTQFLLDHLPDHTTWLLKGGRREAIAQIHQIGECVHYAQDRNYLEKSATTHLSAHLKFGTVSPREIYHSVQKIFGKQHSLIMELHWRDFFTHIAFHFPHVFGSAFQNRFANIQWHHSDTFFSAWCHGQTGFPIVDAGMRELNQTGYMHNRARMITASFLTKDLHIDWRLGEKYFAIRLLDYDPAVNNGNWQWAASTGCDAQPYFRIFNPWLQQKKFDADAKYIKRWIPELAQVPTELIHSLGDKIHFIKGYPQPIVRHADAVKITKQLYGSQK